MPQEKPNNIETQEDSLPKTCQSCDKTYKSFMDFWDNTFPLRSGTFSNGPRDSVLIYRNCECGTTLTLRLHDRRDYTEEGVAKREAFRIRLNKLLDEGKSREEAILLIKKELNISY